MNVVLITHLDADAIGGSPDRGRGIEAGLLAAGHRIERLRLPVRKPLWGPRHLPWWYLRPGRDWSARLRVAADRTDLIIASYLPSAMATVAVLGRGRRLIYDAHNDELRLSLQIRSPRASREIERFEHRVVTASDAVWIAGEDDYESLRRRFPATVIHNLPNGAPRLPDMSHARDQTATVYVYGSWDYEPNRDGIRRLSAASTPIRGRLDVFGRMSEALRRELTARASHSQPGLEWRFRGFTETLESMVEVTRGPGLLPVWKGAGTKLRAVQIAALGVPLITTTEGLSGLPEWFRERATVRDDPAELLAAGLRPDPALWAISKQLREAVMSELSWERLVQDALAATLPARQASTART